MWTTMMESGVEVCRTTMRRRRGGSWVPPINYTKALNKSLMFDFNAQCSDYQSPIMCHGGEGDSWTEPLILHPYSGIWLVAGYYDAGDSIKFNFPQAFSMTMLSTYRAKLEAAGELDHVKVVIKSGTDYFLKTFDNTADTMDRTVTRVMHKVLIGLDILKDI